MSMQVSWDAYASRWDKLVDWDFRPNFEKILHIIYTYRYAQAELLKILRSFTFFDSDSF